LYRTGLDKLPQLLNVLLGQMSLVGPRTVSVEDRDIYDRRLSDLAILRPGMTGPWAISDPSNLEEEIQATLYYAKNWSFWRDLHILAHTAFRIVRAKGSVSRGYSTAPSLGSTRPFSAPA
jgi:lipopolysaccharide/colanic/teichoic acid biosynthesis glycosyltransferase